MERITKKKAIEIIGTAAALLVLFGIIWYVSSSVKKTPLISEDGLEYAKATVVEIVKGNSGGNNTGEGDGGKSGCESKNHIRLPQGKNRRSK